MAQRGLGQTANAVRAGGIQLGVTQELLGLFLIDCGESCKVKLIWFGAIVKRIRRVLSNTEGRSFTWEAAANVWLRSRPVLGLLLRETPKRACNSVRKGEQSHHPTCTYCFFTAKCVHFNALLFGTSTPRLEGHPWSSRPSYLVVCRRTSTCTCWSQTLMNVSVALLWKWKVWGRRFKKNEPSKPAVDHRIMES